MRGSETAKMTKRLLLTVGLVLSALAFVSACSTGSADLPSATPTPTGGGTGHLAFSSYRDGEQEVYLMSADGSTLRRLTDNPERARQPAWSPDGGQIAFVRRRDLTDLEIFVMNADGSEQRQFTDSYYSLETEPAWSPDGSRIAFASDLFYVRDTERRPVTGFDIFVMDVDGSGLTPLTGNSVWRLKGDDGSADEAVAGGVWNTSPKWSPGGGQIAFRSNRDGNNEIYVMDADGSQQRNLTHHPASDTDPTWSPDGQKIAFVSDRDGNEEIYVMEADGSNAVRLTQDPRKDTYPAWSPDGQLIAFYSNRDSEFGRNFEVYVMGADGDNPIRLTNHPDFDGFPAWQPAPLPASGVTPTRELVGTGLSNDVAAPSEREVAGWLQANAIPISTLETGGGYDDLAFLGEHLAGQRIVALGQASYGTHEFMTVKHRLLEYLVKELGFNTFAMDLGWGEAEAINCYIHTGEGDPAQLLASLDDWRWNTEEMLALVEWMRVHNQDPGDAPQVSFCGIGVHNPRASMDYVVTYVQQVDPAQALRLEALYDCYREIQDVQGEALRPNPFVACAGDIGQAYDELEGKEAEYVAASSAGEYARALQGARAVLQAERLYETFDLETEGRYMAENVNWALLQGGSDTRLVLWAHNFDVGDTFLDVDWPAGLGKDPRPSVGAFLAEMYADTLFRIGFAFGEGQFQAIDAYNFDEVAQTEPVVFGVRAAPPYTFEWFARETGLPAFFVPTGQTGAPSSEGGLRSYPLMLRMISSMYAQEAPGRYFVEYDLSSDFDAIIYVERSTPTQVLSLP
jgi:erythromycin esterase-like protein/Tol biopolymer transport system component